MMHESRVSIREVATAARVSVTTVSRVLNEGPVNLQTRQRVLKAIAELGYTPHAGARSLITRRTRTIGLVLPDIHGEFFSELIRGADVAARRLGYHLLVSAAHADLTETRAVVRTLHGRVDGLIVMNSSADAAALDGSLPGAVPVVRLSDGRAGRHSSIRIDNRGGARAMTEYLLSIGHRRIAFICGPDGNDDAAERHEGFRESFSARALSHDPRLDIPGFFTEESGYRAARRLLALAERPTAVFAGNDAMAIGCLLGLREHGVRVPDEMGLAGFDDIPLARYVAPSLTTVRVPIDELGGRAIGRLVDQLKDQVQGTVTVAVHDVLEATLVVRASTAPLVEGPASSAAERDQGAVPDPRSAPTAGAAREEGAHDGDGT